MIIEAKTIERLVAICDLVRAGITTVREVEESLPDELKLRGHRSMQNTFNAGVAKGYLRVVGNGKWRRQIYQAADVDTVEELADHHHREYQRYMVDKAAQNKNFIPVTNDSGLSQYTRLMMGKR